MASSLADIREAIAAAIQDAFPGVQALARMGQVNAPAAVVEPERIDFHDASFLAPLYRFRVTILVALNDVDGAWRQLDAYADPATGVRAALESDHTLGGVVGDCTVMSADLFQPYDVGDSTYLGARFLIDVRP